LRWIVGKSVGDRERSIHEELLTREEVARVLKLSVRTVDRLIASEQIPFIKIDSSVRFRWAEIDEWIVGKSKPRDEARAAQHGSGIMERVLTQEDLDILGRGR
jgi:excisionase family DNA binding protein